MRITFFTHYFPPEGNAPASRTHELCKRWVREGQEVTVITCAPNVPRGKVYEGYKNRLVQREVVDGIRTIRVWTFLAPNEGTVGRILNYVSYMVSALIVSLFLRRPDVVIATSPQFFCGWAGLLSSKLRRLPFILEIRDLWPDSIVAVGAFKNGPLLRVLYRLERWVYAGADRIVTVGEGYRADLVEKGVDESRITVITNGVDRELFSPRDPDGELARRWGVEGKFVCSYIGTVGMASGLGVVLDAAEQFQNDQDEDFIFLIVGDGAIRDELEQRARNLKLKNVVFTGQQDKALIPAFLSITDACLVHLIKRELFKSVLPSKIFEASAMARPIIMGVEGEAAGLVRRSGGGICIEPENPAAFIRALVRLRDDPDLARRMGAKGRRYVIEHFDRDVLAHEYLQVIKRIAKGESAAAPEGLNQ